MCSGSPSSGDADRNGRDREIDMKAVQKKTESKPTFVEKVTKNVKTLGKTIVKGAKTTTEQAKKVRPSVWVLLAITTEVVLFRKFPKQHKAIWGLGKDIVLLDFEWAKWAAYFTTAGVLLTTWTGRGKRLTKAVVKDLKDADQKIRTWFQRRKVVVQLGTK